MCFVCNDPQDRYDAIDQTPEYLAGDSEVVRLKQALTDCVEALEEWGKLALSSDYSGPGDPECLAQDIALYKSHLEA